jgi:hypothetical protein
MVYALFALAGIAGEDDVAPDLAAPTEQAPGIRETKTSKPERTDPCASSYLALSASRRTSRG